MAEPVVDGGIEEAGGWGDDDELDIDPEERRADVSGEGEVGWDVEDADLEIPDLGPTTSADTSDTYVHLPTQGPSQPLTWTKNSQLAVDHISAGSFESACRLLHDQLGIVNYKPYEALFLSLYSGSRTVSTWQQNLPPLFSYPLRNWKEANPKSGLPASGVRLNELVTRLQVRKI